VILVDSVSRRFGRRVALDRISFRVGRGERALLVGPNGAGKTTLLRILTGFLDPDEGRVEVARFGYLPEGAPLPPEMAIGDYLRFRARLKGLARAAVCAAGDEAMTATGLTARARQPIGTLSRGFRQRVGLADALVARPDVLILDEPTAGLDPVQVRELGGVLDRLSGDRTVLLSTHALGDAVAVRADRVIVVVGGRIAADGTPDEVRAAAAAGSLEDAVVALAEAT